MVQSENGYALTQPADWFSNWLDYIIKKWIRERKAMKKRRIIKEKNPGKICPQKIYELARFSIAQIILAFKPLLINNSISEEASDEHRFFSCQVAEPAQIF